MFEYSGAIHIHSIYSDGSGTVEEITRFANEVNLEYIILTDHNTMKAKDLGYEKWHGDTLLIVGYELNDLKNKNHYLVLGLDKPLGSFEILEDGDLGNVKSAKEYITEINENGGFGFIAHPDEKRNHLPNHPPYPFTEWGSEDFNGIEIWNHMSEWMEGLTEKNKLYRLIHPLRTIVAPPEETLNKWDELNMERKVTGIGGVDAHAFKQNILGMYEVEIFPYKVLFKSIRTHIFTEKKLSPGNPEKFNEDKQEILKALKDGRSFIVNSYHGDGRGFRFFAEYENELYQMGDEIKIDLTKNKKITFTAYIPKESKIRFIQNGKCIDEIKGFNCLWHSMEKGCYRIEAWAGDKGWIFSNHIRVV